MSVLQIQVGILRLLYLSGLPLCRLSTCSSVYLAMSVKVWELSCWCFRYPVVAETIQFKSLVLSLDGPLKIARDLAKVGIEDTSFLADVKDEVWEDRMAKLATKKLAKKTKNSGAMLKQKLATFLYSHGYDYEFSKRFIQNLPVEEDLDNLRKEKEQYFKKYASKYEEPKLSWVVKGKLQSKGYTKESILKVFEE